MRTSNKILLGGFVATILILVGIHVALYAKYKGGETKDVSGLIGGNVTYDLGNIRHVSITGMEECKIIPADTARLEMDKHYKGSISYRINADSLVIAGPHNASELAEGHRVGLPITLYLPPVESITANYTGLFLRGGTDSAKAVSQKIELNNSHLQLSRNGPDPGGAWWNNLAIVAHDNAKIDLPARGTIGYLDVSLSRNSLMTDHGVHITSFLLKMDSTSSAALRMHNLDKLKLNKQ